MALGEATITIKKVKKITAAGHHGGAWKVAYADFVTAMMAFFLLMWLINTVSPQQKKGLADYFAPASVSATTSGDGGLLGGTALSDDGAKSAGSTDAIPKLNPDSPNSVDNGSSTRASASSASEEALRQALQQKDQSAFQSAMDTIRQSMQQMPQLAELSKQVHLDVTDDGLLIQLVDENGRSMFDKGSAIPNANARLMLQAVAKTINHLPNRIRVSGHTSIGTSGHPEAGDSDLSFRRAAAAWQILQQGGANPDRLKGLVAMGDSEPLYPDDPTLPGNQRIAILLMRDKPPLPPPGG